MPKEKNTFKFSRKSVIAFLIVVILIVGALVFYLKFYPEMVKANKIKLYKQVVYNSSLCLYSCPLVEQEVNNKTQLAPEKECTTTCTDPIKNFTSLYEEVSIKELSSSDSMAADMQVIARNCQKESFDSAKMDYNMTKYASCMVRDLTSLKDKYPYLS